MIRPPLVLSTLLAVVAGLLALAAPAHAAPVSPQLQIFVDVWNEAPTREYGTYVPITAQTRATDDFSGVPGSYVIRRNGVRTVWGWTQRGTMATTLVAEDPAGTYVIEFEFTPDDLTTYLPETRSVTVVRPKASTDLDLGSPATDVRAGSSWTLPASNPPTAQLAVRSGSTAGACVAAGRRVDFTGAGTCTVDVTAPEDANHFAATPRAVTFQVTRSTTVTGLTWSANPVVIDEPADLEISLEAGGDPVDGTAEVWLDGQRRATVDVDGGRATWPTSFDAAGNYEVEVRSTPTDPGYAPSVGTASIQVTRLSQSISSPPSPAYVGDTWRPTASSGGNVSVTSGTPTVCQVADGQVTFLMTGDCQVDSSVASNETHEGSDRSDSFNVVGVPALVDVTVVPLTGNTQRLDLEVSSVRGTPTGTVALDGGQAVALVDGRASLATAGQQSGQTLHVEISYTPTAGSRWAPGTTEHDLAIPQAPQPVVISEPPSGPRVGQSWTPTLTWSPSGRPTSWTASGACERRAATVSFTAAGDCTVTAVQSAGDGYLEGRDSVVVPVLKGLQPISLAEAAPTRAFVGGQWTPLASAPSGETVQVTATPVAACRVASAGGGEPVLTVEFRAAGECTVTFAAPGTADYEPGERTVTVPVSLIPVDLTLAADDLAVGAEGTLEVTATATADGRGVPGEVTVTGGGISVTRTVDSGPVELPATFRGAGTHTLTVSFAPSTPTMYDAAEKQVAVTVAKGAQAITSQEEPPATARVGGSWESSFVGGRSGEPVAVAASGACTRSGTLIQFTAAGTCTLTVDQPGNADWFAAPTVTRTIEVGLVTVDVTVTVPDGSRVGEPTALDVVATAPGTVEVVVDGQTVSGTGPTLPITFTRAGEREAEVSFTPTDPATYQSYAGRTTLAVAKGAQQLSLSEPAPATRRAGGTWTPVVAGGDSGSPILVAAAPEAVCTADSGTVRFLTFGDCEVTTTQAGSDDYDPARELRHTVSVERRTPTLDVELPSTPLVGEPAVVTVRSDEEGAIQFALDGEDVDEPVALTDGSASVTLLPTAGGERRVTVTFLPRTPRAVDGAQRQVTLDVARAATDTTVAVRADRLIATVTPPNDVAGAPRGEVTFVVDGAEAGVAPLVEGRAVLELDTAAEGDLAVRASYAGSADHEPSTATTVRTNPGIEAQVSSSAPVRGGWHTGPVVVRFTCTGGTAELVEPCPAPLRFDRDGLQEPLTRVVETRDGGRASVRVDGIRIDATAPRVRILGARNGATYKAEARTPRCAATDSLSGLASCRIQQRRTGPRAYRVTATATDTAGNTTTRTLRYRIRHTWLVRLPAGPVVDVTRGATHRIAMLGRTKPTVRTSWGGEPRVWRRTSRAGLPRWKARLSIPRRARIGSTYVVRVRIGDQTTRLRLRIVK